MLSLGLNLAILMAAAVPCKGSGGSCVVKVKVGRATLPMVYDTGADMTVLSGAAARRAGIRFGSDSPKILTRGVGGTKWAYLARATVQVGAHKEEDVLLAVIPDLRIGRGGGLLGMTFLERFKVSLGFEELELIPVDRGQNPRKNGRGQRWWQVRFRTNQRRLARYAASLKRAKKADREIESMYGKDPDGKNMEQQVRALQRFMEEEANKLRNEAGRHSVPHEWRR